MILDADDGHMFSQECVLFFSGVTKQAGLDKDGFERKHLKHEFLT